MFEKMFKEVSSIIVFDTETSGLDAEHHQIIELAALRIEPSENGIKVTDRMDDFIRLPDGMNLDPKITELTHITDDMLLSDGKSHEEVAFRFQKMIENTGDNGPVLLAAHNAQFDLLFARQLLKGKKIARSLHFLDTLTVLKDRRSYPHRLENAITYYDLEGKVQNSHRAIDDVEALLEVMKAMEEERSDLHTYIDIFGFNPKYGISGKKIQKITYRAQAFTDIMRSPDMTLPALAKGGS